MAWGEGQGSVPHSLTVHTNVNGFDSWTQCRVQTSKCNHAVQFTRVSDVVSMGVQPNRAEPTSDKQDHLTFKCQHGADQSSLVLLCSVEALEPCPH